jgi:hypothetical protein
MANVLVAYFHLTRRHADFDWSTLNALILFPPKHFGLLPLCNHFWFKLKLRLWKLSYHFFRIFIFHPFSSFPLSLSQVYYVPASPH